MSVFFISKLFHLYEVSLQGHIFISLLYASNECQVWIFLEKMNIEAIAFLSLSSLRNSSNLVDEIGLDFLS